MYFFFSSFFCLFCFSFLVQLCLEILFSCFVFSLYVVQKYCTLETRSETNTFHGYRHIVAVYLCLFQEENVIKKIETN